MAAILPCALESLNFAETPIAVTALIASCMQIPIEDVAGKYFNYLQRLTSSTLAEYAAGLSI
jgi:hypothetical protein